MELPVSRSGTEEAYARSSGASKPRITASKSLVRPGKRCPGENSGLVTRHIAVIRERKDPEAMKLIMERYLGYLARYIARQCDAAALPGEDPEDLARKRCTASGSGLQQVGFRSSRIGTLSAGSYAQSPSERSLIACETPVGSSADAATF